MKEMVRERQNSEKVERHDLFTTLLEANNDGNGGEALSESELISKPSSQDCGIVYLIDCDGMQVMYSSFS